MIISRTPFRISFFGGGTDYPAWYRRHGGQVLGTTIDKYCYITCRNLPPFFEHRYSVSYSKIETCRSIEEISHPAVRTALRYLDVAQGVAIKHDADLPARSGMGSSSAFTVGLLHALHALQGSMPSRQQLAKEAIYLEQDLLREAVGSQDQVLAAVGGFNCITFRSNNEITVRPVTLAAHRIRELQRHLMLFFTGFNRTASAVAATFTNDMEAKGDHLRALGSMVDDGIRILSDGGDIRRFGELLHVAWEAKRSLSDAVSHPEIEVMYEEARAAGAIGGKLLGAGGGGFMLLFVPPALQPAVRSRLTRFIRVPFAFEPGGSQVIFFEPDGDYAAEEAFRAKNPTPAFREFMPQQGESAA